jgi:hypothetical protein
MRSARSFRSSSISWKEGSLKELQLLPVRRNVMMSLPRTELFKPLTLPPVYQEV